MRALKFTMCVGHFPKGRLLIISEAWDERFDLKAEHGQGWGSEKGMIKYPRICVSDACRFASREDNIVYTKQSKS